MPIVIAIAVIILVLLWACKFLPDGVEDEVIKSVKLEKLKKVNLYPENIKSWMAFSNDYGCLIYTKDERLFNIKHGITNSRDFDIKEIPIDDILEVKLDVHVSEKNQMKIISLTPTFNTHSRIIRVDMIITTVEEVINLQINDGYRFNVNKIYMKDTHEKFTWEQKINELNRLKLLIDRKIRVNN